MKLNPAITLLALGELLVWAGAYYVFPALLLRWEADLGWSRESITLALMLATFSMAIASPVTGRLIDLGYGPQVMGITTIVAGICIGLLSRVESLTWFYIIWIVNGAMLAGCLYEPCFALITRIRGVRAKTSITAVTLIAGFASTVSFPAAHYLSELYGWQTCVLIFAAVVVCVAAPLLWAGAVRLESQYLNENNQTTTDPATAKQERTFLKRPMFWLLGCGFAIAAVVHGTTLHHLLPLLNERGLAAAVAVLAVSLIGPMQVGGRVVIAVLGERLSNHTTVVSIFIAMAASIVCLMAAGKQALLLFVFVLLFGGSYGILSIIRPVIARELLGGNNFGAKSGVLAFMYLIGAGSSPWIGSLLWRAGGYSLVLQLLIALMVLALIFYSAARRLA